MYPENPEGTQVIVILMNMGYISDPARNRAHNLFRPKQEQIPLGHICLMLIAEHKVGQMLEQIALTLIEPMVAGG